MIRLKSIFLTLIIAVFSLQATPSQNTSERIECTLRPVNRATIPPGTAPSNLVDAASSGNWSGYVAASNLSHPTTGSVTAVSGTWSVPRLHSTTVTAYSASWVGIDGFSNGTVEQIGTAMDWYGGTQQNYAWFEMYPGGSYEIVGFPVNPGDSIFASVTYIGSHTFVLTIENLTRRVYFTVPTSYTQSSTAQRTSAEWIMEAPYYMGILPLANFGTETFTNCRATINGIAGPINSTHWQNESINMVGSSYYKALTSSLYGLGLNFIVTWEHL